MKLHLLAVLLLIALGPACKTAGPPAPAGPAVLPEPLGEYRGEIRLMNHTGEDREVETRAGVRPPGSCALAVRVHDVSFEKGTARFSLHTVGMPSVRGQEARCRKAQPGLQLRVTGLAEISDEAEMRARVDELLMTPETYLESQGVTFDRPAAETPTELASREPHAPAPEKRLSRQVTVWPEAVLSVDPWHYQGSGAIRQEGEVELEVFVGTDGRLYEPRVRTGMSAPYEQAVLRVMPLWRFEPARTKDGPVGARLLLRPILRVF